jgi:hypothetical protein
VAKSTMQANKDKQQATSTAAAAQQHNHLKHLFKPSTFQNPLLLLEILLEH